MCVCVRRIHLKFNTFFFVFLEKETLENQKFRYMQIGWKKRVTIQKEKQKPEAKNHSLNCLIHKFKELS